MDGGLPKLHSPFLRVVKQISLFFALLLLIVIGTYTAVVSLFSLESVLSVFWTMDGGLPKLHSPFLRVVKQISLFFALLLLIVIGTYTAVVSLFSLESVLSVFWTMDGGLPMLNCLLQHTLRSLCTTTTTSSSSSDSSNSAKWVYSVFWRILPRNYPPPKWDHGGSILDRAKGNKRNWILVWEDGFCDFYECERAGIGYVKGRFGADIFFKMSHEVYNFGEGLVGKVASDNSHKWVFRDCQNENDPSFIPSWNVSIDPQPRAWEAQFNSGIQTIAIIAVGEGIIQLGSFDKVAEDLNLVISIQRKFSYLQSIPGIYSIQRPYLPIHHPHTFRTSTPHLMIETSETAYGVDDKRQLVGSKRLYCDRPDDFSVKSINLGYNSPHNGIIGPPPALWSIPPLLPSTACNPGAAYNPKVPSISPSYNAIKAPETTLLSKENYTLKTSSQCIKISECCGLSEIQNGDIKVETTCALEAAQEGKPGILSHSLGVECRVVKKLGFGPPSEEESALNLN